jgi:hypothetical protein
MQENKKDSDRLTETPHLSSTKQTVENKRQPPASLADIYREKLSSLESSVKESKNIQVEEVEKLKALSELMRLQKRNARKTALWPIFTLLALLILVSFVLFQPVSQTEIELIAEVSEVSFQTPQEESEPRRPQRLITNLSLQEIGFSNLTELTFPRSKPILADDAMPLAIELSATEESSITLEQLSLQPKSDVTLAKVASSDDYALVIAFNNLQLELEVNLKNINSSEGESDRVEGRDIVAPTSLRGKLTLLPGKNKDKIDEFSFTFSPIPLPTSDEPLALASQLLMENLKLSKVVVYSDSQGTYTETISTVESGSVFLEALDREKQEVRLRPGEELRFSKSEGTIRLLELTEDTIRLQFRGIVSGMTVGSEENPRSIMPTILEYWQAKNSLLTFLSGLIVFTGFLLTLLRWWRDTFST